MQLGDRLDGVALLAEAYNGSEAGKYRELVRYFELAFRLPFTQLEKILYDFHKSMPFGYSRDEIRHWVSLRHPSTHADGRKSSFVALTPDVRRCLGRMEQSALDVLFNKSNWGNKSTTRREVWKPDACTTNSDGHVIVKEGSKLQLLFRVYDEFGIYPRQLEASLTGIQDNWYMVINQDNAEGFPT